MRVELDLSAVRCSASRLVLDDSLLEPHRRELGERTEPLPRLGYAALHVVLKQDYARVPHSLEAPGQASEIGEWLDFAATDRLRRRVDRLGFGVAEAMDTAQRFFLGWENARHLIERCSQLGLENGFIAGAGVDDLDDTASPAELVESVVDQARSIQQCGGTVILLPMVALAQQRASEDLYVDVYRAITDQLAGPLFVHWLGEMFHSGLAGYFPGQSFERVMALDPEKVRGVKLSLLDSELELETRKRLSERGQIVLTGDDFHFAPLLVGDGRLEGQSSFRLGEREVAVGDFSHALLGAFDAVAEPVSLALRYLARGDRVTCERLLEPAETLSRFLFQAPTEHYKAGLAFHAWLNGWQDNFLLVNHEQRARDLEHYLGIAQLAVQAGTLENAELSAARLDDWLSSQRST